MKTAKDFCLFNGEKYTYQEIRIYKDGDSRLSRRDSWCIKQLNERLYLTTDQMIELRDLLTECIGGVK